ncbi:MAG: MMPL family transporter [Cytophagales bacterium]|nr:MMPL family transporter [Cytophagales bacterium]
MNRITSFILKNNIGILVVTLLFTIASIVVMVKNIYLETDLDEYMPKDHPSFTNSDEAEELFDIRDAMVIAIENKEGVYNPTTLQKVKDLTKTLGRMEEIQKSDITSLYTADNIRGSEEGLEIDEFYKKVPTADKKLLSIVDAVTTNDMIHGLIVSEDQTATLIITKIDDEVFTEDFYHSIVDLADSYQGDGDKLYVAGQPIIEGTMAILMPKDMKTMLPIVMVLIVVVLMFVLKSFKATILSMMVVIFSTMWSFGIMAAFSIPIYAVTTLIPVLLIAIGVADGIHMFSHLQLYMTSNKDKTKEEKISNMISEMWKPVVMTSITTAVGFLSLLTSEVYPIKYFAVFAALGVLFAMVLSLVVIPAGTQLFGLPRRTKRSEMKSDTFSKASEWFALNITKYKKAYVVWTVLFVLFFGFGASKVWINSSFLERFPASNPIVQTDAFVNDKFMGTTSINVILEGDEENTFKSPEVLNLAEKMMNETIVKFDQIGGGISLNDFLKRMNKVLNEDREEFNSIPDKSDLVAQYILLYEMSGDPDKLWEVVDEDFKTGNYNFQVKTDNSKTLEDILEHLETYKNDFKALGVDVNFAGSGYTLLLFNNLILEGQIKSLVLSFFIVLILLALMFKSWKVGFIGTIPILITAIISFGVLGWLNIPLETTTALISSIAIGIGIDYAVHFIDRYKINALATSDKELTITKTMSHSGRAISFNAIVVIAGFLVLLVSEFLPNQALGAIVSLNMFTSFFGTVTIMFLVLYITNIYFKKKK